jgi:hypothetical protein
MSDAVLTAMRDAVQTDPGGRGLAAVPGDNLFTAFPGDFEAACRSVATRRGMLGIVTGFFIASADPPCGETDGPLGAVFLARALAPAGIPVTIFAESCCASGVSEGLAACGLSAGVPVVELTTSALASDPLREYEANIIRAIGDGEFKQDAPYGHFLSLEHVGPSHTRCSLRRQPGTTWADRRRFRDEVPRERRDRCYSMRGRDITAETSPAHRIIEIARGYNRGRVPTIGIGDGGNELGMGKIPWDVIRRNIPNGGQIACRVPTDHLIVAGVSNWGAYALAAGVRYLRGVPHDPALFDPDRELQLLERMVERGPLVDGVAGKRQATVDGLSFEEYAKPLARLGEILRG